MADPSTDPSPASRVNNEDVLRYWEAVDADVNGMLGGFPQVSKTDLQGSRNFLAKLGIGTRAGQRIVATALEGGAGIGRITKGLLLDVAMQVDVVEPVVKFTDHLRTSNGVRHIFSMGLQDWDPAVAESTAQYDLIWNQWCLGSLTDEQLIHYLCRCRAALQADGGLIVVKENLSTSGVDLFDEEDGIVTRTHEKHLHIFQEAGLQVIRTELQRGFPKKLFPVRMYALKQRLD